MLWVGQRRWTFISDVVVKGKPGCPWAFPQAERWVLNTGRLSGAPPLLRALLCGVPKGDGAVRGEIRQLCAQAVQVRDRWVAEGTVVQALPPWLLSEWRRCPSEVRDVVSRCTGSFSDGTLRSSATGVVCGFGVAWGASGLFGCVDGVVTCGASAFRGEGAGAAVAISEHARSRPGTVLHLHSDCGSPRLYREHVRRHVG